MTGVLVVAGLALRESVRRKLFLVVLALTTVFGGLYTFGAYELFRQANLSAPGGSGVDGHTLAGATLLGLAMFGLLFLGALLSVFLCVGAVRGDAERGILQPLVVRPIGRPAYLLGRFLAAALVSGGYVVTGFLGAVLATRLAGSYTPQTIVRPALELGGAVVVIAGLATLGSVLLSITANAIAVLMAFATGLVAGLLGEIGEALGNKVLGRIADITSYVLPFEALYRDALRLLTASIPGLTGSVVRLGPLGGSRSGGPLLIPYVIAYLAVLAALAVAAFRRLDI